MMRKRIQVLTKCSVTHVTEVYIFVSQGPRYVTRGGINQGLIALSTPRPLRYLAPRDPWLQVLFRGTPSLPQYLRTISEWYIRLVHRITATHKLSHIWIPPTLHSLLSKQTCDKCLCHQEQREPWKQKPVTSFHFLCDVDSSRDYLRLLEWFLQPVLFWFWWIKT